MWLNDLHGKSAGNIDVVLVAYDENGRVYDFGAVEIQAVYISGNVRDPFEYFMKDPRGRASMDWSEEPNYPRPDYLSPSRKRLVPQLLFKGGILHAWGKKMAVAVDAGLLEALPDLYEVPKGEADAAWMVYDLSAHDGRDAQAGAKMKLVMRKLVYSRWPGFVKVEGIPSTEPVDEFRKRLDGLLWDVAV